MAGDYETVGNDRLDVSFTNDTKVRSEVANAVSQAVARRYDIDADRVNVMNIHADKHGIDAKVFIEGTGALDA